MATKTRLIEAALRRLPDGRIEALSSDGHTVYDVSIGDHESCTCRGWAHYGKCYHVSSARRRFPAFYTPPAAPARRAQASDLYA